jgi:hypothetical protein
VGFPELKLAAANAAINFRGENTVLENHKQGKVEAKKPEQKSSALPSRKELVSRADLETFVHLGDQISHYEAVDTRYPIKMPKNIEQHARLIDEGLKDISVCDPAVGSGAFPVGMMTEIVRARSALTPYFNDFHDRTPYHFKRHAIQNCLYGVDIDPGAVEIAKLRLWLSLVVDEEDVKQIKPLPNLFYKIVTGNSLLGVTKNLFNQELFRRLEELKPRYFDEPDRDKKARYKQEIEHTIHELTTGKEAFDFEIYFSEVFHRKGGFDVVIGNPPYVRIQELKKADAHTVDLLKANYASARRGNYDIYVVFVEKGLQLLNQGGQFAYILPHKFFNAQYGEPLRELISQGKHLQHVVHFGDLQLFEGATNYVCLLFLAKPGADECRFVRVDNLEQWFGTMRGTEGSISAKRITGAEWNFAVGKGAGLFEKLQTMSVKLGDIAHIFVGLQTSADDVFIMDFVSETARTRTLKSAALETHWTFEKELLHPIVSGTDVSPFASVPRRQFILFPYAIKKEQAELIPIKAISESWPRAAEYLKENKRRLEQRENGKFRGTDWHRFGRSQNLAIQDRAKLCVPRLVEFLHAAPDFDGTHYLDNVDVGGVTYKESAATRHHLSYLLALLNSRLMR